MVYDIEMLREFYALYATKVDEAKNKLGRAMTLAEKILYAHVYDETVLRNYRRRGRLCEFSPEPCGYAGCYCSDGFVAIYECG